MGAIRVHVSGRGQRGERPVGVKVCNVSVLYLADGLRPSVIISQRDACGQVAKGEA